jgi:uncharacterized repeat protein (TIGR03803 family)
VRSQKRTTRFAALLATTAVTIFTAATTATAAHAQDSETVICSFPSNALGGAIPKASLIFDSAGNLYGTTILGGAYDCGTVFELTPQ